jgi:hypothetical protein
VRQGSRTEGNFQIARAPWHCVKPYPNGRVRRKDLIGLCSLWDTGLRGLILRQSRRIQVKLTLLCSGSKNCQSMPPKCQAAARATWLDRRAAELLPVEYFHIVFTLPQPIATLALQNQRVVFSILFRAAAETLWEIAADPRHLGAWLRRIAQPDWGGLCQATLWRTATSPEIAGPLYPSRGHFQPASGLPARRPCDLPVEGLFAKRSVPHHDVEVSVSTEPRRVTDAEQAAPRSPCAI